MAEYTLGVRGGGMSKHIPLDNPDTGDYDTAVWLIARSPTWRAKGLKQALGRLTKAERQQAWKQGKALRRRTRINQLKRGAA